MNVPTTSFQLSTPMSVSEFSNQFLHGGSNGFFTSRFMFGGQSSQENQQSGNGGQFESRLNNGLALKNFFSTSQAQSLMSTSCSPSVTSIESSSSSSSSDSIPDEFRQAPSLQFGEQLHSESTNSKRKLSHNVGNGFESDVDKLVGELLADSDSDDESSKVVKKKIKIEAGESDLDSEKNFANEEQIKVKLKPQIGVRKDLFMKNAPSLHPTANANVTTSTPIKTNSNNSTTISVSSSLNLLPAHQEINAKNILNNDTRIPCPNINPFVAPHPPQNLNSLKFLCDTSENLKPGEKSNFFPNPLQNSATLLNVIKRINDVRSDQRRYSPHFPSSSSTFPAIHYQQNQYSQNYPHIVSRMYEEMVGGNTRIVSQFPTSSMTPTNIVPVDNSELGQNLTNRLHGSIDLGNFGSQSTRPRYKKKTDGVPLFDDPTLPPGWTRSVVMRKSGTTAGGWDTYIHSPAEYGFKKFRSKQEIRRYFEQRGEMILRWEDFDFNPFGSKGQHEILAKMKSNQIDQADSKVIKEESIRNSKISSSYNPGPTIAKASNSQMQPNNLPEIETKFDINSFLECEIKEENIV